MTAQGEMVSNERRFKLDMRKKFFIISIVKHWKGLPKEVVEALSLDDIQGQAGSGFDQLADIPFHGRAAGLDDL